MWQGQDSKERLNVLCSRKLFTRNSLPQLTLSNWLATGRISIIVVVLGLVAPLFLHGCEESDSDTPPGKAVCKVSATLASSEPNATLNVALLWRGNFYYDKNNATCRECCGEIQKFMNVHPDYTSLCAAYENPLEGANLTAGDVYAACAGCADIVVPPEQAELLCEPCDAGKYSSAGRGVCEDCPAGRWSGVGYTVCTPCAGGRFSTVLGAVSSVVCTECEAGRDSSPGSSQCSDCQAGRWSIAGTADCFLCAAGKWSIAVKATTEAVCTLCHQGKYGITPGAADSATCLNCAAGRWNAQSGSSHIDACSPCLAGQFSTSLGAVSDSTCVNCPDGTFSATVGAGSSDACAACQAGTWSASVGCASSECCTNCEKGRYSPTPGASSVDTCLECPGGTFAADPGTSQCADCGRGNISASVNGSTSCDTCSGGYFQAALQATACTACQSGRFSATTGATAAATCDFCLRGTVSGVAALSCDACVTGKYAALSGLTGCSPCDSKSVTPEGAHACCPHDTKDWPLTSSETLSIPPGKHWTDVFLMNDGDCDPGGEDVVHDGASKLLTTSQSADPLLFADAVHVSTLKQGLLHSCLSFTCKDAKCGVMPPEKDRLMPGVELKVTAFIGRAGISGLHQCEEQVEVGFAGFGCEENTILTFLLVLVAVVSLTILLGILFERLVRRRVTWFVETTLKVMPPRDSDKGLTTLPTTSWLANDVQQALPNDGPVRRGGRASRGPTVADIHAWSVETRDRKDAKAEPKVTSVNVDCKIAVPKVQLRDLQKWLQGRQWVAGPGWVDANITVDSQPPACIKEAAKMPGADLMEAIEMAVVRVLSCFKQQRKEETEVRQMHVEAARQVLGQFMQRRTVYIIIAQTLFNWIMIMVIPAIGLARMTCAEGYPYGLHGVWAAYVILSSLLSLWLLLKNSPPATRNFLSLFRVRLALRFGAMVVSVTDLYQDATFPVIAGRCGFDLWWVSLWLVFLGVGVMQVLVQIILLYGIRRRYLRAKTPEERERAYIEGIFLALRGCDNHVLVYLIKPAVEERLGGGSSWSMKTMEARVAFLRFVFEDAEQSALQMSFLLFFDQATTADKVWVGLSTGTSLMLSFTLTVQTLAEVRDWLWYQLLAWFPGGARWPEARILWLLFLILLYRTISIFPWLGSCTPAGDHNASTLRRLLLFSDKKVPQRILTETLMGSGLAFAIAIVIVAIACCIWAQPLRLPSDLFYRLCCGPKRRSGKNMAEDSGAFYDFQRRLEVEGALALKREQDDDSWLESLRYLHALAKSTKSDKALDLLADIDDFVFQIVHATRIGAPANFQLQKDNVEEALAELEKVGIPDSTDGSAPKSADVLKALRAAVKESVDVAVVRGRALHMLADRNFRRASMVRKAELIDEATDGRAPFRLLHWSVLEHLGQLPAFGDNPGAEDVPTALKRCEHGGEQAMLTVYLSHTWTRPNHPDTTDHEKAKILVLFAQWLKNWAAQQRMNCEVFFWIDYSCMDAGLDIGLAALPLFVATCTQVLMWRTPDFERRSWTMVERLLAYSFCPGGMTPFAVSASSFQAQAAPTEKADDKADDDDIVVEDFETPKAGTKPASAPTDAKVVPIITSSAADDWIPEVYRRARKLPDPLDASVCRPSGLAAANVQRRRVQQLVETALAVPALETFADRQPVDFGLTEVIEQFLGARKPLEPGEPMDVMVAGGTWLKAQAAAKVVKDWHLTVQNVKAPEGTDGKAGKSLQARPADEEGHIVILDRIADDSKAAPAAPPKPEEIRQRFDELDAAYEAQVSGKVGDGLEESAVKLIEALRADLSAAEASGDEKYLRDALARTRDVDLPVKQRLTKKLCQLQLTNAIAAKDIIGIQMAMRFARQNELQDLQEYQDAQAARVQLQKEKLHARALAIVHQDTPDVAAIVSVIEVARRRGWNDIADEALNALKAEIEKTKDAAGISKLARVYRLAKEQSIHAIVTLSTDALENLHNEAVKNKDAAVLCNLIQAGDRESCADIADSAKEALRDLIHEWRCHWQDAHRDEASAALKQILSSAQDSKLEAMVQVCSDAIDKAKDFEAAQQAETRNQLQPSATAKDMAAASKVAAKWAWDDIAGEVVAALKKKIEAAAAKDGVEAVVDLAEIFDVAGEYGLAEVADAAGPEVSKAIDLQRRNDAAAVLLEMARALEARGFRGFAGQARQALRELVEGFKASDSADAARKLAELHDAAETCGDGDALGLADGAIDTIKDRWEEKKAKLRDALKDATDADAVMNLIDVAKHNAWTDIADEGLDLLRTRIADSMASGGIVGFSEVAKARHAAKTFKEHSIVDLTGRAFNTRIEEAKGARDSVPLLEIARAAEAEGCREIGATARKALTAMIKSWKDGPLSSVPASSQALVDLAQSCGEDDIAKSVRQIVNLAKRKQSAKDSQDASVLAELVQDAEKEGCSGLQQEILRALKDLVTAMVGACDVEALRGARDAARGCGLADVAKSADDIVVLADQLATAKAGKDYDAVLDATSSAVALGCDAFATDGRAYMQQVIRELQKEAKLPGKRQLLKDLHLAAKKARLDDIADLAVDAVGGCLPKDWASVRDGKKGGWVGTEKHAAKNKDLIDRIQAMVDATFQGWGRLGHDTVTRDRYKTKNPLSTRLKVEEVIHVENTENYLNFMMRREKVAQEFKALPAADRKTDWDVKTTHVSLKGTWRHPEEPCDPALNEVWLWHGTNEGGAVGITDSDFDMARAGTAVGSMFGRGLYFAESCLKSDEYTHADARGWNPLLLCRVVLGRVLHCDHPHPWEIADTLENACKSGEYHSVLGDREKVRGTYRECVVFDNDQVYPEYIVWYSRQPPFKDY